MDQFLMGAGIVAGLAFVSWLVWIEWRLKKLQSATLLAQEKLKDEKIQIRDHALSNDERRALLDQNLGSGNTKT